MRFRPSGAARLLGSVAVVGALCVAGLAPSNEQAGPVGPVEPEWRVHVLEDATDARLPVVLRHREPDAAGRSWEVTCDALARGGTPPPALCRGVFGDDGGATLEFDLPRRWLAARSIGVHGLDLEFTIEGRDEPIVRRLTVDVQPRKSLGVNLASVEFYSQLQVFRNQFLMASRWIPQRTEGYEWDTGEALDIDENGWVRSLADGQVAAVIMLSDLEGRYRGGRWVLEHEGTGRFEARLAGRVVDSKPGRVSIDVDNEVDALHLRLVETDPEDPVRNIRLHHVDDDLDGSPFQARALELLSPFQVIRFMDWQRTNDSEQSRWSDRSTRDQAVQTTEAGVALEYIVELANELDADPWVCVPHLADDDYVRRFAELLRDGLEPERRVYLEYSNEVWNDIFSQARWAREQGLAAGLSDDEFQAQLRYYSQRSVEVMDIAAEVFASRPERLVRVLAGHHANPWVTETILDWKDAWRSVDAYAVAPYFGHGFGRPESASRTRAMKTDRLLSELESDMREWLGMVGDHRALCEQRGLRLLAYEGGQHMVGIYEAVDDDELTAKLQEANRDPAMADIYLESLELWKRGGGELFCAFNAVERWTKWGSWGALEHMGQSLDEAPKYRALVEFSTTVPPWWVGGGR